MQLAALALKASVKVKMLTMMQEQSFSMHLSSSKAEKVSLCTGQFRNWQSLGWETQISVAYSKQWSLLRAAHGGCTDPCPESHPKKEWLSPLVDRGYLQRDLPINLSG